MQRLHPIKAEDARTQTILAIEETTYLQVIGKVIAARTNDT